MKALLVIDMQAGSFTDEMPRYDAEGVVARINNLAKYCRAMGHLVIFLQHDGTKENRFFPGTSDWEFLPTLDILDTDITVSKTANDCFYGSKLQSILYNNHVDEVIVTGCATDFCVDTTIRSALARDYSVTVVEDGHTTANRRHIDAKTVIAHHNWVWENLIPTKNRLNVVAFKDIVTRSYETNQLERV